MTHNPELWILDDDASIRWVLERTFNDTEFELQSFSQATELYAALEHSEPDVLLSDIRMPGDDGLQVLKHLQKERPELPIVIMTAHSDLETAVKVFKGGAFEYLAKPFDLDEVLAMVRKALQHRRSQPAADSTKTSDPLLIGESPVMQDVFRVIGRLSQSSVSVLITGETGTGKELVARALHQHSPRSEKTFVALNMAAIPSDLIESELFGHERGAFTGADKRRMGRFEQANQGTLFLDEIGDMPLSVQTRLLRVLAEGQFYPVGAHQPITVDVRVIAATHRDLKQAVADNQFREDLYHRLNVIQLQLPALRERNSDIVLLSEFFLKKAARDLGVGGKRLSAGALKALQNFYWPGNVRQLENVCRWLTVMAPGQTVQKNELPAEILQPDVQPTSEQEIAVRETTSWQQAIKSELKKRDNQTEVLTAMIAELERTALQTALTNYQGHKQQAARWLGWGRNTLTRKIKRLLK
ncbi:nitrogen regulation protein NR(I) [Idiomarina seosinensis]|uniref:nitrogen regulation protein NR(I) n=1 Tax=Idiomarina seosinensis TaxID=281739 RepID=UPI00384FA334